MIPAATVQRYQPPNGDIYKSLAATYGQNGALLVAQAARTSEFPNDISNAIVRVQYGERLEDSTAKLFLQQITTNPLAAPLEGVNKILGKTFLSFLTSPWVLLALGLALFVMFGGLDLVKRRVAAA